MYRQNDKWTVEKPRPRKPFGESCTLKLVAAANKTQMNINQTMYIHFASREGITNPLASVKLQFTRAVTAQLR